MAWIEDVTPEAAEGELVELYEELAGPDGQVDSVLRIHGLRPRTLRAHLELYVAALHRSPNELSRRERELVGTVVSALNGCDYCVAHHRVGLARQVGGDEALTRRLVAAALEVGDGADPGPSEGASPEDGRTGRSEGTSPLTDRERALVRYARKLTRRPDEMEAEDLVPLRSHGLSDAGILDLNQVVAYFAYVNRLVLGLGVETGDESLGLHPEEDADGLAHR